MMHGITNVNISNENSMLAKAPSSYFWNKNISQIWTDMRPWLLSEPTPDTGQQIFRTCWTEFFCVLHKTSVEEREAKTWTAASSQDSVAPYRSCHTSTPAL